MLAGGLAADVRVCASDRRGIAGAGAESGTDGASGSDSGLLGTTTDTGAWDTGDADRSMTCAPKPQNCGTRSLQCCMHERTAHARDRPEATTHILAMLCVTAAKKRTSGSGSSTSRLAGVFLRLETLAGVLTALFRSRGAGKPFLCGSAAADLAPRGSLALL